MTFKRIIVLCVLLTQAVLSHAQQAKVVAAYTLFQKGNLDSAIILINQAVADSGSVNDGQAWYLRGYFYKTKYKGEKINKQSPARIEALNSFKRSLLIDTARENVRNNKDAIKYLASTLFNDVGASLDSLDYKLAIENFEKFEAYSKLIDTAQAKMKQNEISFLLALANVYVRIYGENKKDKTEFLSLTKNTYNKVFAIDPNNIKANYGMGILYYNEAVNLMNQSDYDIDIVALSDIQDNAIKLFRESLPFMEKAYDLNPKRREVLLGLSGIYFSLNEKEKSEVFKQKLQQLGD